MNLKKMIAVGTVACIIGLTGCSSNIPENNQGNRNGMRLTESAMRNTRTTPVKYRSANRWSTSNNRVKAAQNTGTANQTSRSRSVNAEINTRARDSVARGYNYSGTVNRVNRNTNADINTRARNNTANFNTRVRNNVTRNYDYNGSTSANEYRNSVTRNANRLNRNTRTIDNVTLNDVMDNRTVMASSITNTAGETVNIKVSKLDSLINTLQNLKKSSKSSGKTSIGVKTAQRKAAQYAKKNVKNRKIKTQNAAKQSATRLYKPKNYNVVPQNPGGTVVNKNRGIVTTRSMRKTRASSRANRMIMPGINRYAGSKNTQIFKTIPGTRSFNATNNATQMNNKPVNSTHVNAVKASPAQSAKSVHKTPVRRIMMGSTVGK